MVERGRGGLVLVTSGAAFAGGSHIAVYAASKAFDLVLAEGLWAEWHDRGVDVLSLVVGATDTPSLRASLEKFGATIDELADPADVAREGVLRPGMSVVASINTKPATAGDQRAAAR